MPAQKALLENTFIDVSDNCSVGFQSRRADHGDKQPRDLVIIAALLFPYIFRTLDLDALGLVLRSRMLPCEAGVIELHHCGINFLNLLLVGVARSDDSIYSRSNLAGWIGELVEGFCPVFPFGLPIFGWGAER